MFTRTVGAMLQMRKWRHFSKVTQLVKGRARVHTQGGGIPRHVL